MTRPEAQVTDQLRAAAQKTMLSRSSTTIVYDGAVDQSTPKIAVSVAAYFAVNVHLLCRQGARFELAPASQREEADMIIRLSMGKASADAALRGVLDLHRCPLSEAEKRSTACLGKLYGSDTRESDEPG